MPNTRALLQKLIAYQTDRQASALSGEALSKTSHRNCWAG